VKIKQGIDERNKKEIKHGYLLLIHDMFDLIDRISIGSEFVDRFSFI
jgi:hypothetical protein